MKPKTSGDKNPRRQCQGCQHSELKPGRSTYVTWCQLARRVVPPDMAACQYWRGKDGKD